VAPLTSCLRVVLYLTLIPPSVSLKDSQILLSKLPKKCISVRKLKPHLFLKFHMKFYNFLPHLLKIMDYPRRFRLRGDIDIAKTGVAVFFSGSTVFLLKLMYFLSVNSGTGWLNNVMAYFCRLNIDGE
jgi:hypothetical protein